MSCTTTLQTVGEQKNLELTAGQMELIQQKLRESLDNQVTRALTGFEGTPTTNSANPSPAKNVHDLMREIEEIHRELSRPPVDRVTVSLDWPEPGQLLILDEEKMQRTARVQTSKREPPQKILFLSSVDLPPIETALNENGWVLEIDKPNLSSRTTHYTVRPAK